MAIVVTRTCDKCNCNVDNNSQLWEIGVSAKLASPMYVPSDSSLPRIQVCRQCLEELGIHVRKETVMPEGHKPPTTEELIREIVTRCVDIPS